MYAPQSCPEAIPIVNLLPQLVLSQAIRLEAYLQNELLIIDGLHLYGENDVKIWPTVVFQFSIVENVFEPPKVTVLTVIMTQLHLPQVFCPVK